MTFRFLPHTADTILAIESPSVEEIFVDATAAARLLLAGDSPGRVVERREVTLDGAGYADLLYRYLRELIVWFQVDVFIPTTLQIAKLNEHALVAQVHGEAFTKGVHEPQPEVKAVTRHQLTFDKTKSGWRAVVILDL